MIKILQTSPHQTFHQVSVEYFYFPLPFMFQSIFYKYPASLKSTINLLQTMGGGCSMFRKPLPVVVGGLCSSATGLVSQCKNLATAKQVSLKQVAAVISALAGFVDSVTDLFESLDKGNSGREMVKNLADLTKLVEGLPEDKPVPEETIVKIVVTCLQLVKSALKITKDFVSEYKDQLDIAIKAIDEGLKPYKRQMNGQYGEKKIARDLQNITS